MTGNDKGNAPSERRFDRLTGLQFVGVLIGLLAFVAGEALDLLGAATPWLVLTAIISVVGWALFIIAVLRSMSLWSQADKRPVVIDERVSRIRDKAMGGGFQAMLLCQAALILLDTGLNAAAGIDSAITVVFAAMLSILVGIATALGRFAWLSR